ncbi:MAG: hypothetical protein E7773_01770 [Sphingomonas sp.]|uniref:hypothetical protein n=1 Tax=Sphingomonas sp. TaxID=28214 RepID=UPI0012026976|nr:hypothetical protein [Sphingomonas sp.]THD37735.1 MAG: hypothetical protein E7773_01770 [Sphingomonas sp.]
MRRITVAMIGLAMLAACSRDADPVGENSADSIKTTAVGNVVATIPSPTPTPTAEAMNDAEASAGNVIDSMSNAM